VFEGRAFQSKPVPLRHFRVGPGSALLQDYFFERLLARTHGDAAPLTLLRAFVSGLLLLLLLLLVQRSRRLLPLMGGRIIQLERQPQLRVAIRLIGKTQESLGQVLKLLAEKFVFLRLGEHISCLKTICV